MNLRKIIFEIKDCCRSGSRQARRDAAEYERLSGAEKKERDFQDRLELVKFAYRNIPFYHRYYTECGFDPENLHSEADWESIPIVEKRMLRELKEQFLLPGVPKKYLAVTTTGGSTGQPLKLYKDRRTRFEAIHWRALQWYNVHISDNVGIVNRRVPKTAFQKWKNRLLWFPTRRCYLDASTVNADSMAAFLRDIKRQKTRYLTGYCGSLEHIADFVLANGIHTPSLKLVWSTTNPLLPDVRKRMETAFGCPVMDQYGCCEMPNIAVQRPGEDTLTVNSDYVHVDIVDDSGKLLPLNESGDILITDLKTTVFPLIKYRLGDRGYLRKNFSDSSDGFPRLAPVQGRITDTVFFPDGSFIDGAYLTTICDAYSDVVDSYQVYQDREYHITLKIVLKNPGSVDQKVYAIGEGLKEKISGRAEFKLELCDSIPDDRGKRRYVISEIALSRQAQSGNREKSAL